MIVPTGRSAGVERPRTARSGPTHAGVARRGIAIALLLAGLAPPLLPASPEISAQDDAAPQTPVERVEVRGDGDRVPLDSSAFATVIRAEDFADRVTSVPELLRESVGVQVQSLGGDFATVSIRGSSAEQVVIYLDGIPLNRSLGGPVNLAELPLGQVESIEIYRGTTPASLPSASIGGAILIHTRRATGRSAAATASASYGSYGTGEAIASGSGIRGRIDFSGGADVRTTRGDFVYLDDNGTPFEGDDDHDTRRTNNGSRRDHLSGQASIRAGERSRLSISADFLTTDQGVPGIGAFKSGVARFSSTRFLGRAGLEVPGLAGGKVLLRGAADFSRYSEAFDDSGGTIQLAGPKKTENGIDSIGQEAGLVLVAGGHQGISLFLSHRRETADLEDRSQPSPDLGTASRDTLVATIEDEVSLLGGRLVLNPSLRREAYSSRFGAGDAQGLRPEVTDLRDARTTGKGGFRLRAGSRATFKGNFGRFLRLPDFIELFGNRGSILGNPSLRPESGLNLDLGVAVEPRTGPILRQARIEASLFETRADNLILFKPVSHGTVVEENAGRSRVRGVELTLDLGVGARFSGSLNVTRQRAIDVSGDVYDGKILPGRPEDEVSATAGLLLGRGRIFYTFTYVGPNYVDQQNTVTLAARYLHDAGYRIRLPRGLQAAIEIKNLTDQVTYDVARYPLPGRSLEGRLSWQF
jgi:outer membrane cobalamin receptor